MQYPPETPQGSAPPYAGPPAAKKSNNTVLIIVAISACGCVFLAVIILAAIMFPVFAQAHEKARQTSCLSNEKQMALGMLMYVQDYDEKYPPANNWMSNIQPYIKNEYVFHCPSVSPHSEQHVPPYGYAFNSALSKVALADIASPKTTLMLYDSNSLGESVSDASTSFPVPARHTSFDNFGFADGHCHSLQPAQLPDVISGKQSDEPTTTGSGGQP